MFELLTTLKEKNPLVVHYTNDVTVNDCANITLAIGASPMMSACCEEVAEAAAIANSIVINIGTMNSTRLELYLAAGKAANAAGVPVLLDPAGVFATKTRSAYVEKLLGEVQFDIVKGNAAEIGFLAGAVVAGKGVDSGDCDSEIGKTVTRVLSKHLSCTVGATGVIDTISDGTRTVTILNGSRKLKSISGTGCMASSLVGSYMGLGREQCSAFDATVMGILSMAVAGELADVGNPSIGSYRVALMNSVYELNAQKLREFAKIKEISHKG